MAYEPILGPNVKRFDDLNPGPWNDFFENAAEVFNTTPEKIMPFDAAISTGDKSNQENLGINTKGNLGATYPAGYDWEEGQIAISDNTLNDNNVDDGNTAEHEYMHNIETHFGHYENGVYGQGGPASVYVDNLLDNAIDPKSMQEYYDYTYLNGDDSDPRNRQRQTPLGRYLVAPHIYKDELATSLTGYGGRDGEYEYQMMKDSWEKRGPMNQYTSSMSAEDFTNIINENREIAERIYPTEYGQYTLQDQAEMMQALAPNHLVYNSSAQEEALERAFNNNPINDRLGFGKGLIAPMVAQSLSDSKYELGIIKNFPVGQSSYKQYPQSPLEIKRGDTPRYERDWRGELIRNNPSEYKNSIPERFARLGAQYMKREDEDEFNHNRVNQSMFRVGMNDLLTRMPLRLRASFNNKTPNRIKIKP